MKNSQKWQILGMGAMLVGYLVNIVASGIASKRQEAIIEEEVSKQLDARNQKEEA